MPSPAWPGPLVSRPPHAPCTATPTATTPLGTTYDCSPPVKPNVVGPAIPNATPGTTRQAVAATADTSRNLTSTPFERVTMTADHTAASSFMGAVTNASQSLGGPADGFTPRGVPRARGAAPVGARRAARASTARAAQHAHARRRACPAREDRGHPQVTVILVRRELDRPLHHSASLVQIAALDRGARRTGRAGRASSARAASRGLVGPLLIEVVRQQLAAVAGDRRGRASATAAPASAGLSASAWRASWRNCSRSSRTSEPSTSSSPSRSTTSGAGSRSRPSTVRSRLRPAVGSPSGHSASIACSAWTRPPLTATSRSSSPVWPPRARPGGRPA